MAFRTNYRFARTERDRAKKAKKAEKLKKRQEIDTVPSEADAQKGPDEHAAPDA